MEDKPKRGVWECDVFSSVSTVRDEEGEYQPLMTMIVDGATGFVYSTRMFGRAYRPFDALSDDLQDVIARLGRPERVDVKDAATAAALKPLADKLKFALEGDRPLNALYAARRAMAGPAPRRSIGRRLTRRG